MKKFYSLLLVAFFLPVLGIISNAQMYNTSANDPEKFYLFDSDITVHTDGSITVVETITLNVKHQEIRRGIYRDIPFSLKESVKPISLTFDGENHPFFIEFKGDKQRINFGDDNYIARGKHTYTFTYKFIGAIDFYKNYDELYWNVTGSNWAFPIDKARVHVTLPEQVQIQKDGISLYTGYKGSKANYTEEVGKLTYETTRPLSPREGMTIAIPFDKGVIQKPSSFQSLSLFFSPVSILAILLLVGLFIYFISTWIVVGIDPSYLLVPQYEPPQNISPAFMYYLCTQGLDTTAIACILLSLAMKGHIEIKENKSFFAMDKATIILKNRDTLDLPEEEAGLISLLFPNGADTFSLGPSTAQKWTPIRKGMEKLFKRDAQEYIVSNSSYIKKPVIGVVLLGLVPPLFLGKIGFPLIFINLHFAVFFTLASIIHSRISLKVILGLVLTAFYSAFWIPLSLQAGPAALICSLSYVLGMWGLSFYVTLIRNVTERGKELFAHIYGFKKYMKTAEINRVYASDPTKAEQIFCAFLPFAFAFGLENKWMKKFEGVLSKAIIDKCTSAAGGIRFISSGGLSKSVSSGGDGGSHGGGHSGGGHGGGGGGGR